MREEMQAGMEVMQFGVVVCGAMLGGAGGQRMVFDHLADFVFGDAYLVHVIDHIVQVCVIR